jgi:hypothetical protein
VSRNPLGSRQLELFLIENREKRIEIGGAKDRDGSYWHKFYDVRRLIGSGGTVPDA